MARTLVQRVRRARPARHRRPRGVRRRRGSTRSLPSSSAKPSARSASFATTFGAQTGLAITPLLCFGTDDQKARYLPRLVSGRIDRRLCAERIGIRIRRARREDAGRRVARMAAICSPARRCGSPTAGSPTSSSSSRKWTASTFTAFLVERGFPGVSTGKEEHKMGLHGSSTTPLILQEAGVPAGQRARRNREGPQGRVQRPQLRPLQACRDVQRRRARRRSARPRAMRRSAGNSASRSRASARSGTSWPR